MNVRLLVGAWCVALPLSAQTATPVPQAPPAVITTADNPFTALDGIDRPAPSRVRSANGMPGPAYWQQRADYNITVTLDTAAHSVRGAETVRYTNNSPDSLRYLWMQVDQNLFRSRSKGAMRFPADSRFGARGFEGGYELTDVRVNGKSAPFHVDDTMMRIDLDQPLAPQGGKLTITMGFSFRVPEHGSDRMGHDGSLYQIAQWYPRMAVYDDVRGWNTDPYLGQGEFYLEYGDIDFSITAPAGYTIAATGVLQNPNEVLSATQRSRLAAAAKSSSVVQIITNDEANATPTSGTKTWHFRANNVRDVAWAGAPDFRWDATSWNGIICQAYYQMAKAGKAWESAAEETQFTIKTYSELFFQYPYPQATSVAGPVAGMEYPMFVMVRYGDKSGDPFSTYRTIDHELGHQWFPMIVGSNERRYAWQDEGINTYINTFALERRYAGTPRALEFFPSYVQNWRTILTRGLDVPLMTPADDIPPAALGAIGYRKPAAMLLTLRNQVLGKEMFDAAFRAYINAWAFKHPTPGDFFRAIESFTGTDLSWFWRTYWYGTASINIGVDSVANGQDQTATVYLRNVTGAPLPVTLRVKYKNGRTQDLKLPAEIWTAGSTFPAIVPAPELVVGVRIFPDPTVPDWNSSDKTWGDAPSSDPPHPVTTQ